MGISAKVRPIVETLSRREPLPPLAPKAIWSAEVEGRLKGLDATALADGVSVNNHFAQAVYSGLFLLNDSLAKAHALAMSESVPQSVAKQTLDYWHGIMHRREPDYPNSKYWFRQVGDHPHFPAVLYAAKGVVKESSLPAGSEVRAAIERWERWEPFLFVDLCQKHEADDGIEGDTLRRIQLAEMTSLLDFCAERAHG